MHHFDMEGDHRTAGFGEGAALRLGVAYHQVSLDRCLRKCVGNASGEIGTEGDRWSETTIKNVKMDLVYLAHYLLDLASQGQRISVEDAQGKLGCSHGADSISGLLLVIDPRIAQKQANDQRFVLPRYIWESSDPRGGYRVTPWRIVWRSSIYRSAHCHSRTAIPITGVAHRLSQL